MAFVATGHRHGRAHYVTPCVDLPVRAVAHCHTAARHLRRHGGGARGIHDGGWRGRIDWIRPKYRRRLARLRDGHRWLQR